VELPYRGDLMRYVAPEGFFWKEISPAFLSLNRNKLHAGLDLHPPEGKELFLRLASVSDVVVENLRAGTMDEWGVGISSSGSAIPGSYTPPTPALASGDRIPRGAPRTTPPRRRSPGSPPSRGSRTTRR